ncbi:MAG: carbonate dehydratase [Pseudomonadota bacterium]
MAHSLENLFKNNHTWAEQIKGNDPEFFLKLSKQQAPEYLWIGCADSRVPANEIVGLLPGELFVHRNVANIVHHTDLNCLSVIQYAVEYLKVKHIIVCGHYGCGGVRAACTDQKLGLIDNWLRSIRNTYLQNLDIFAHLSAEKEKVDLLCELNVIKQVANVSQTTIVQDAWQRGQDLSIHGVIYSIENGILKDLKVSVNGNAAG